MDHRTIEAVSAPIGHQDSENAASSPVNEEIRQRFFDRNRKIKTYEELSPLQKRMQSGEGLG